MSDTVFPSRAVRGTLFEDRAEWSPDGRRLATAGKDHVIKVWDVRTGDQARTIQGFTKEVTSIHFVADGADLLILLRQPNIRLASDLRTLAKESH